MLYKLYIQFRIVTMYGMQRSIDYKIETNCTVKIITSSNSSNSSNFVKPTIIAFACKLNCQHLSFQQQRELNEHRFGQKDLVSSISSYYSYSISNIFKNHIYFRLLISRVSVFSSFMTLFAVFCCEDVN